MIFNGRKYFVYYKRVTFSLLIVFLCVYVYVRLAVKKKDGQPFVLKTGELSETCE